MWQRRLKLGTYFRIGVYVHWSFALLVAYVGYAGYQDGIAGAAFGISLLFGMFFCVTLHEYGHALTARRFGIETLDITLFPIGGVARLMKIPRIPWQEFLVAVAGPAVNVVILIVVGLVLLFAPGLGLPTLKQFLTDEAAADRVFEQLNSMSIVGYLAFMMLVNMALILFNMIPAFPMDGGRVLRSILAMGFEYRRATRIASIVGVICALGMFSMALYYNRPMPGLIAIFICYAGLSEAKQVNAMEPLRHLKVRDAMDPSPPCIALDAPVDELVRVLHSGAIVAVPVVGPENVVIGMVSYDDLVSAKESGADWTTTVGQIVRHDTPVLLPEDSLESVVTRPLEGCRQFPVADPSGQLIGMLNLDTLRFRLEKLVI